MALKVEFGNGATSKQFKLQEGAQGYAGDSLALNGPALEETSLANGQVGSSLPGGAQTVGTVTVPGGASGTGGDVIVSRAGSAFTFNVDGEWNSVKNAKAVSDAAESVSFKDFVHVDVDFSAVTNTNASSTVSIYDVKRGNVATGAGADTVLVTLATNNTGYQNQFNVSTGAGSDSIKIGVGNVSDIATITDGRFTTVTIDAGSGNDTIDLSGLNLKLATITGGTGNDTMTGSNGVDVYQYNAQASGNSGYDTISNFQVGVDKFQFDGSGLGIKLSVLDITGQNTDVLLTDNTVIKLLGVTNFGLVA